LTPLLDSYTIKNSISKFDDHMPKQDMADRDLYSGLIRLHILHHAAEEPIFGLGMAEELARHGYKLSLGTLYPLLHGLERKGYLRSSAQRLGKTVRRVYRATPAGRKALATAKSKVRELVGELIEGK
jgi:PadR family transcriptional regulator PadR